MPYFLSILLITACDPVVEVERHEIADDESVEGTIVLLSDAEIKEEIGTSLGTITVREGGMSVRCAYHDVVEMAKASAQDIGANALVIKEHRGPHIWSTCHQIESEAFLLDNIEHYEDEIIWSKDRRLTIANFKASADRRPYQAVTHSSINYTAHSDAFSTDLELDVKAIFHCDLSYFKRSHRDSSVLAHEQIHFDITELYARKLRKRLQEECRSFKEFDRKHDKIFSQVNREWSRKQEAYDTEVYADPSKQIRWNFWITEELSKLQKYANSQFTISGKS